jgi:hypothetical protein
MIEFGTLSVETLNLEKKAIHTACRRPRYNLEFRIWNEDIIWNLEGGNGFWKNGYTPSSSSP